jgi:hypothetical protein
MININNIKIKYFIDMIILNKNCNNNFLLLEKIGDKEKLLL